MKRSPYSPIWHKPTFTSLNVILSSLHLYPAQGVPSPVPQPLPACVWLEALCSNASLPVHQLSTEARPSHGIHVRGTEETHTWNNLSQGCQEQTAIPFFKTTVPGFLANACHCLLCVVGNSLHISEPVFLSIK